MTTSPQQRIEAEVKAALKAGEKERLSTLRMLLTEIKNEKIRRIAEVDEAGFVALVRKGIKQREESITQYQQAGRNELAAKEQAEMVVLNAFLPPQVDEAEIRAAIQALVDERGLEGKTAIGVVMKEMMARFGSAADGGTINRLAREALAAQDGK
jgi:uncharacterized protein YqeY